MSNMNAVIKKQENGTWAFRASLKFDPKTGKRIQRRRSGFRTKAEAKDAYYKLLATDFKTLRQKEEHLVNFEDFVENTFKPWYKTQVKIQTFDDRSRLMKRYFKEFWNMKITAFDSLTVQKWQNSLLEGHSALYARRIFMTLSMVLQRAVTLEVIPKNPARIVGNIKAYQPEIDFWTKEEFEKVIAAASVDSFPDHFTFVCVWISFMTGLRSGEAKALQWEDLDWDNHTITVNKTVIRKGIDKFFFSTPKTKSGYRTLSLDQQTMDILLAWYEDQRIMNKSSFILSMDGLPLAQSSLAKMVDSAAEKAHVHRITVHALRHSHASLLIHMGENPLRIKERLGHADVRTTLGIYGHLYPNSNVEIAERLGNLIMAPQNVK
ncbi:tyrosine-type recombinase/integrase [Furfurilactobacillus milii]|uniref:Tyrosine-type recombinase/integrase n=1 Tax=Furfurilactobacillus milii TaxID=2888272 RepID=A0A6N9HYU4_9LACO|nr:tyrosine-type recombinase/integrase [Furfurilactobacillus milii]MYV16032.1 tyrosine-type recombinase/integrase [Furfurilactobacillus milii]